MSIRINKFLSEAGVCSRRAADEQILAGKVKINGVVARLGDRIDRKNDKVEFEGKLIKPQKENFVYYALNKPKGIISTSSDERSRQNITDLVPKTPRVYPIGRLDKDSEGLILLTNDGEFANEMMHPSHQIDKEYEVIVEAKKRIGTRVIEEKFLKGLLIDDKLMKADKAKVFLILNSKFLIQVVLHTGYNRQIRKMCVKMGLEVKSLKRTRIGNLSLNKLNLKPGEYQLIDKSDLISPNL